MPTTGQPPVISDTDFIQKVQLSLLERLDRDDAQALADLPVSMLALAMHLILGDDDGILKPFTVTPSATAMSVNVAPVATVASIYSRGLVAQTTATVGVGIADNTSGSPRVDAICARIEYIDSSLGSKYQLTGESYAARTAYAVGTGDGVTKLFELPDDGVVSDTFYAKVGGTVTACSLYHGLGTTGHDVIVFADAPASGAAITATYSYKTGGVETAASLFTRYDYGIGIGVVQGTPGSGAPSDSTLAANGWLRLADVTVPDGYTTALGSMFTSSHIAEWQTYALPTGEADLQDTLSLFKEGAAKQIPRIWWKSATEVVLAPPLIVRRERDPDGKVRIFKTDTEIICTLSADFYTGETAAGWKYLYAQLDGISSPYNGVTTVKASDKAPEADGRRGGSATLSEVFVGSIYWDGSAIKEFYTEQKGRYIFKSQGSIGSVSAAGTFTFTPSLPATALSAYCRLNGYCTTPDSGDAAECDVKAYGGGAGEIELNAGSNYTVNLGQFGDNTGIVPLKDHQIDMTLGLAGSTVSAAYTLWLLGYAEDVDNPAV